MNRVKIDSFYYYLLAILLLLNCGIQFIELIIEKDAYNTGQTYFNYVASMFMFFVWANLFKKEE